MREGVICRLGPEGSPETDMGEILTFPTADRRKSAETTRPATGGEIVFFTGVRYERDSASATLKSAKPARRTGPRKSPVGKPRAKRERA